MNRDKTVCNLCYVYDLVLSIEINNTKISWIRSDSKKSFIFSLVLTNTSPAYTILVYLCFFECFITLFLEKLMLPIYYFLGLTN